MDDRLQKQLLMILLLRTYFDYSNNINIILAYKLTFFVDVHSKTPIFLPMPLLANEK